MDGFFEGFGECEAGVVIATHEFVARFAEEDNVFDPRGLQDFVEFGKVFVVGFVTTADDNSEVGIGEGIESNASGGGVGGEIVVVDFDAVIFAEEFETMRKAVEGAEALDNRSFMLS